ncbi:hypothetical protein [Pseudomonas quasicaspiana]|uniref:hypothetical protein n=1 Tax=Pseudomonas quasicaspiana TaxID=2829821 RepID=UPI001E2F9719|nr:hypothetical protein [Pseudomonas quasicaspiana]MCD5980544.1 hypothetical protein [Pseudomonas quasicaspiana]
MSVLSLPGDFSTTAIVHKVEQRFGLSGFARLVKLLELFAASPFRDLGVIELPASDWCDALQAGPQDVTALLSYLAKADWLTVEQGEVPSSPLRVTLSYFEAFVPVLVLPKKADQWRRWFEYELALPTELGKDPYNQDLFRRWCATNVTVDEMESAIELARQAGTAPSPTALHEFLKTVRNTKIERARR